MNKEMCHKCKKYLAEYNQTECEFCLGISSKDDYISDLEKKISRLTNNWNELEKWLSEYRTNIENPDFWEEGIIDCLDEVLNKLNELKEKE